MEEGERREKEEGVARVPPTVSPEGSPVGPSRAKNFLLKREKRLAKL
jgi:hypothetical protein